MLSLSLVQTRLAAIVSFPGRLPGRARELGVPALWIVATLVASLVVLRLTSMAWLALVVALAGMVLAAWQQVKTAAGLRESLARSEHDRLALEQALRDAQTMEALGRLTVGVAHDFNNHLTVISSNVEMVTRRLEDGQERLRRHADAAILGVQRAAALTSRLLSFTRRDTPEAEAIDVDRLLAGLSDLLHRTLGDRIALDVQLSNGPCFIWADLHRTENAVVSLAANARDLIAEGDLLTIAVSNVRLDDTFAAANPCVLPGDYVQIAAGRAMPRDQPLSCDDGAAADLFMARAFAREAGGCLLRSEGVLRIFLPRHQPLSSARPITREVRRGRPTILVVEDDAAVRAACVEALRELDYSVQEAPDAMHAFRLIEEQGGFDLLFTDVGLPGGVNGRTLADAARTVDPRIRVLFTTGYDRPDLPERASSALLRKPFNPSQLAAKVEEVLAGESVGARTETVQG